MSTLDFIPMGGLAAEGCSDSLAAGDAGQDVKFFKKANKQGKTEVNADVKGGAKGGSKGRKKK